jgi:hypothetical protein
MKKLLIILLILAAFLLGWIIRPMDAETSQIRQENDSLADVNRQLMLQKSILENRIRTEIINRNHDRDKFAKRYRALLMLSDDEQVKLFNSWE